MALGAGYIGQNLTLPPNNHGVIVPRFSAIEQAPFPTRTEEYWFAARVFEEQIRGLVVDAGCGWNPEIHLLPDILSHMAYVVYAIDANPRVLDYPPRENIERVCGTMAYINLPNASVDYWVCISVLEHIEPTLRVATVLEAGRLLRPGGLAVVTADDASPERLNALFVECGFLVGPEVPFAGTTLQPSVAWLVAQKPHV